MKNIITIIEVIFFLISIWAIYYALFYKVKINKEIHNQNEEIKKENIKLSNKHNLLIQENEKLSNKQNQIKSNIDYLYELSKEKTQEMTVTQQSMAEMLGQYAEVLDQKYLTVEKEYDNLIIELETAYDEVQNLKLKEIAQIQKELDKIRNTRAAALEAQLREQEIKDNLSFYCLQPSQNDIDDVHALERVKPNLHQPRILCMLIWSTYFQKPMTALCNNVLGTSIVTGIYKITNQQTSECYIGQSVDIAKRWKDHAKCGLGIDTPAANKLYKAIQEYGIWNFSWELLEKCNKEELDKKEAFYIELYQSKEYGYNSSIGIKKS